MKLVTLIVFASLSPTVAGAQVQALSSGRVVRVEYRENDIVSIRGRMGYAIDVELQAGERVINIAAGNLTAIEVGVEAAHVFVKPKRPVDHMNIVVLTDRRIYRLDYRADSDHNAERGEVVHAVVFNFPEPPASSTAPAAEVAPPAWNANYWFCGASELRPEEAFDDGVRTYLRFSGGTEFPAAYSVDADGEERLVNAHAVGDWIVVHQTPRRIALRRGRLVACVENRGELRERSSARGDLVHGSEPRK